MYLPIYPKPTSMVESDGCYVLPLKAEMRIAPGAMDQARKELVCDLWYRFACTAAKLTITEDAGVPAHAAVIGDGCGTLNAEDDYAISVTAGGLCVQGADDLGLLRGCYTLLQMICPVCLEEGKELLKKWGLPENFRGVGNCILGYAAEDPEPRERLDGRIIKV